MTRHESPAAKFGWLNSIHNMMNNINSMIYLFYKKIKSIEYNRGSRDGWGI